MHRTRARAFLGSWGAKILALHGNYTRQQVVLGVRPLGQVLVQGQGPGYQRRTRATAVRSLVSNCLPVICL